MNAVQVAPRQGVVEGLVPAVEQDLPERRRQDDGEHAAGKREQGVAQRRVHEGPPHHRQLIAKALVVGGRGLRVGLAVGLIRHRQCSSSLLTGMVGPQHGAHE